MAFFFEKIEIIKGKLSREKIRGIQLVTLTSLKKIREAEKNNNIFNFRGTNYQFFPNSAIGL